MSISQINNSTLQPKEKMYLFSNNPFIDAGIQGGVGVAAGAGVNYLSQRKVLKNPEKLQSKIARLEKDIVNIKNKKNINKLKKELQFLKDKKYDIKAMLGLGLIFGGIIFVTTLAGNLLFFGGKKAFDKMTK